MSGLFVPFPKDISPGIMKKSHIPGCITFIPLGRPLALFLVINGEPGNRYPVFGLSPFRFMKIIRALCSRNKKNNLQVIIAMTIRKLTVNWIAAAMLARK
jgi:hypothetical protein